MSTRILFVCGSTNQTRQMHQISQHLPGYERFFTPYYADGYLDLARRAGLVEFSVLGNRMAARCRAYLAAHDLAEDPRGDAGGYDLVLTCSDLVVPRNIRDRRVVLVQEGMTDPENIWYHLYKRVPVLPRWLASTSTTGLSDRYEKFCVASAGYRDLFIRKGVRPEKLVVTGIPNFDNCAAYRNNTFPHTHYVLVCTSDARETFKWENRPAFIRRAVEIARGRPLIFKLHPNERVERATKEIGRHAPGALVFSQGNTEEMIANCDVLITKYSSVVYVGIALGKEVYSGFDVETLRRLVPEQNASAAQRIADVCREVLGPSSRPAPAPSAVPRPSPVHS